MKFVTVNNELWVQPMLPGMPAPDPLRLSEQRLSCRLEELGKYLEGQPLKVQQKISTQLVLDFHRQATRKALSLLTDAPVPA